MQADDYREALWNFTFDERRETFFLNQSRDETELYESLERKQSSSGDEKGLPIALPVSKSPSESKSQINFRGRRERNQPFEARASGDRLWQALPEEIKNFLRDSINSPNNPLRLKIYSTHPAVTDLPWEQITYGAGSFLALHPNVRLVRSVPVRLSTPPLTVAPPLRVLVVMTNPKDERLLDPYGEQQAVAKRLFNSPDYDLQILGEPTLEALQHELSQNPPHVLHYIGHAGIRNGQGCIILHDPNKMTYWMSANQLAAMLPTTVRLVCLSTCFTAENYQIMGLSRFAHSPARLQLPTMIANQFPIDGQSAETFWDAFYTELIIWRGDIGEAFHKARLATAQNPSSADWTSFQLVLRDGAGKGLHLVQTQKADDSLRFATELRAQMAVQIANSLAEQVRVLGDDVPSEVRDLYETETARASDLTAAASAFSDDEKF